MLNNMPSMPNTNQFLMHRLLIKVYSLLGMHVTDYIIYKNVSTGDCVIGVKLSIRSTIVYLLCRHYACFFQVPIMLKFMLA